MNGRFCLFAGAILFASACSTNNQTPPPTATGSSSPPIKGKLNTSQYELAPSWIPVQAAPQFKEGTSLTAPDTWPQDGAEVDILCQTTGGEYANPRNPSEIDTTWYQINVPNTTVVGYLETAWVTASSPVPPCNN